MFYCESYYFNNRQPKENQYLGSELAATQILEAIVLGECRRQSRYYVKVYIKNKSHKIFKLHQTSN